MSELKSQDITLLIVKGTTGTLTKDKWNDGLQLKSINFSMLSIL